MFWLPRKTIYKGPSKQRGNIVLTLGLPPTEIVDPAGDYVPSGAASGGGGWTSIGEWSVDTGQLVNIEAAFLAKGGRPRAETLEWSPDGTRLTLESSSSDDTICFACSTPFDPDTATEIFTFASTNPGRGFYNKNGTRFCNHSTTDTLRMRAANGWAITSGTILSDVGKSEVGFTSSTDGWALFGPNFDYILWIGGDGGGDAIKNISIPGANLDAWSTVETYNNGAINPNGGGFSNLDKSETIWYRGYGSQGLRIITLNSPREVSSYTDHGGAGNFYDLRPLVSTFDFRVSKVSFDPNDTRYVWGINDPSSDLQIVRFATNVPTSYVDP